ncbi:polysaccharide biosynthesis/export family protein [Phyllobacterium leguminum]|uniref:Exopolysaccharide production protein ExoF n=1 Tax=Phyllobacterium leguminum TaxID=314237 RepID=A0A318TIF2_9HYPH|nr:polysaccharide biosynthesis/export family protein [Phyllobacterium leguminum]PYE88796.1 exopolysaccharide production protein ExoF [Phyllobacterium leguminum]
MAAISRLSGALLPALLLIAFPSTAAEYKLGPMDKLSIRVVEWQTAEGTFREWPTISGNFTVGPSGALSLPFTGELQAGGKTTSQIAGEIAKNLQQKFGLRDRPEAAVEIAEFRPIFVSGDVETPGKYAYDPELTVLKAVSLAGGMRRGETGQRFERDFLNARGNHDVLIAERNRLLAKRARLEAELANAKEIKVPKELADNPDAQKLIGDEAAIMLSRKNALTLQLNALNELRTLYQNEIVSLEKKMVVQNRQKDLMAKELANIGGLADKGLVVNSRVMTLETSFAEMQSKLLDLDTNSLRAKQEINKATRDATDLENSRKAELTSDMQATQAALDEANLKLAMYRNLMTEALVNAPAAAALAGSGEGEGPVLQYSIVRNSGNGETKEIAAEENTPLLPGDLVKAAISNVRS